MMGANERRPRVTRVSRFVRGRLPDRNPLRRTSDRVATLGAVVLIVAFLTGAPFAALASCRWASAAAHRAQGTQGAAACQVTAVLLQAAPVPAVDYGPCQSVALARWTAPGGKSVTGEVLVAPGAPAGTKVQEWVTLDGQVTNPPALDQGPGGQVVLAGAAAVTAVGVLLTVTGVVGRWALNKRRIAAWDADWRATEPRWTHRR